MVKKISVSLLGKFAVRTNTRVILENATKLTKPWQLFVYLLLKDGEVVSGDELLRILWDGEELSDPANVLKNTVFALRRELSGKAKPADSPIVYTQGGYRINPDVQFVCDTKQFMALCQSAVKAPEASALDLWRECVTAYTGEFLPMMDTETWIIPYARLYKEQYVNAALQLCALLYANAQWDELLSTASRLNLVAPLNEDGYLYVYSEGGRLQMTNAIVTTYNKTARFFEEELNVQLCEEICRIHAAAAARVNKTEQDILIIRDDLEHILNEQKSGSGALFCNYDAFKRMMLLLYRSAARSKGSVELVLITVQDTKGHTPSPQLLSAAMEDLKAIIGGCLRKSDTCCRYSRAQYAILMLGANDASATHAINRLKAGFAATANGARIVLSCKSTSFACTE